MLRPRLPLTNPSIGNAHSLSTFLRWLAVVPALFWLVAPLSAAKETEYEKALALIYNTAHAPNSSERKQAETVLQRSYAQSHHPDVAYLLGTLSEKSTEKNHFEKAFYWYTLAAEKNQVEAQRRLGLLLHLGFGHLPDQPLALSWLQKAAHQQDAEALYYMGLSELEGWLTPPNPTLAVYYFEQAKNHYLPARYNLALLYANGSGVPRNTVKAATELDIVSHGPQPLAEQAKNIRNILFLSLSPDAIEQALTAAHHTLAQN